MFRHVCVYSLNVSCLSTLTAASLSVLSIVSCPTKAVAQGSSTPDLIVIAARAEIKHGSRVVGHVNQSQRFRVLQTSGNWYLIKFATDGTPIKGWIKQSDVRVLRSTPYQLPTLTNQQQTRFKRAKMLERKAHQLSEEGKYRDAIPLANEVCDIYRVLLGESNLSYASSLYDLAELHQLQGSYVKARPLFKQALDIRRKIVGIERRDLAESIFGLATLYQDLGAYARARALLLQARSIWKKALGDEHPDYARSLYALAILYQTRGDYAKAKPLFLEALEIRRKALGVEHRDYAESLNILARFHHERGEYTKARPLYVQAWEIRKRVLGESHPDYAMSLNNLGILNVSTGDFAEAQSLLIKAREIWKETLGEAHPNYADSLDNLATLYEIKGNSTKAELLYSQAMKIKKNVVGEMHPWYASSLNHLAKLYQSQGAYSKAEPLYVQAREIEKNALGESNLFYATSLHNLASLYNAMGDHTKAEALYLETLRIERNVLGETSRTYASSLNNLAMLYSSMDEYTKAEPLSIQVLGIMKKTLGESHPDYATSLRNLASLYESTGDYTKAQPLLIQAKEITKQTLGDSHPSYAGCLSNLASLYQSMGDYAKAEPMYFEALEIRKKAWGESHPDYATSLNNLALMLFASGRQREAAEIQEKGRRSTQRYIDRVLPGLSDKQHLMFLNATSNNGLHPALSMGLARVEDSEIAALSAGWLLNSKSIAQESLTNRLLKGHESRDPHLIEIVGDLRSVRSQLARLTLKQPSPEGLRQYRLDVASLLLREQTLSKKLGLARGEIVRDDPWVEVHEVRQSLTKGTVFVDIVRLHVFNFRATGQQKKWQDPHYVAWVIPAIGQGKIKVVDLGKADAIENVVQEFRDSMSEAPKKVLVRGEPAIEKELDKPLKYLASLVLDPLLANSGNVKHLILCPDASLWLIPWAALPLNDGRYAVEEYLLHYAISGRDLVTRKQQTQLAISPPLIIADPDFDLDLSRAKTNMLDVSTPSMRLRSSHSIETLPSARRLPATAAEAQEIAPSLQRYSGSAPQVYTGAKALESVLKTALRPKVVTLATHGFFMSDQEMKYGTRVGFTRTRTPSLTADGKPMENPLLRCGLLFAGCNQRNKAAEGQEDGVLTGLEIVGIDLRGTELVVLSACQTGVGEIRNGEGVAGLRQAFQLAGARSVVASLWRVSDLTTAQLMRDFFSNLADGQDKAEALRSAQLTQITSRRKRTGAAHPFFWSAFTLTGN